jgi:hypothetical protein
MSDLLFVVVVLAFFALGAVFVAGCERIIGRSDEEERVR